MPVFKLLKNIQFSKRESNVIRKMTIIYRSARKTYHIKWQ